MTDPNPKAERSAEREWQEALQLSASRLELIARVSSAIIGEAPMPEAVQYLAEQARLAFRADACVVRVLEGDWLYLLGSAGIPAHHLRARIAMSWGISKEIIERKSALFLRDVRLNPSTAPYIGHLPNPYAFISYAGAPLLAHDDVLGILGIYSAQEIRDFTPTDLEHLQIVANHIAASIRNERLFREVQRQKEELEQQMQERKRLQEQLLQSQKMESLGRLAGGVAHDFNNLLAAIMGYTELATHEIEETSPARQHLQIVQQATERAACLTQNLLTFARKQEGESRLLQLNEVAIDTDRMLRRLLGKNIELVTLLQPDLWTIEADPNQLAQVLMNLAVNARDAMPEGGTLTIQTQNQAVSETNAALFAEMIGGDYVRLRVQDTGVGMSADALTHLFEPFFTTKAPGQGTGLGLSTCYGIVKRHAGQILVYSAPGQGTTVDIYLPRSEQREETPPMPETTPDASPEGGETILLAEDEALLRDLMTKMLRKRGYTVLEAANGSEALEVAEGYPGVIHLLITDVMMPHIGGTQLAERLQQARPSLLVLYLSGYADEVLMQQGAEGTLTAFLQKPFQLDALAQKARELLTSSNLSQ